MKRCPGVSLSRVYCTAFAMLYMGQVRAFVARHRIDILPTRRSVSRSLELSASLRETRTATTLPPVPNETHRIVLMRHGESEFNNVNVFTGWCDVSLTQRGVVEAVEAGQVFASHQLTFRKCYVSLLTRSIVTAHRALEAAGVAYTPLHYDWRLNERHYGALQGLSKERTADRLGRALVMQWRRSYEARPPLMKPEHPHYAIIRTDARYRHLKDSIPLGESLEDCQKRAVEAWNDILQDIKGTNDDQESPYSLLVAHANTLRALVMHLDEIPPGEIEDVNIPTAIPFYYDICKKTGRVRDNTLHMTNGSSASIVNKSASESIHGGNSNPQPDSIVAQKGLGRFRGMYISDERKKRSFLERRRTANDPWLWALHDHQVDRDMLMPDDEESIAEPEGLRGIEEEAAHNTQLFSPKLQNAIGNDGSIPPDRK